MTIQEFKTHIEEELRHKLKCDNEPTPILDRLELHLKDFDDYDLTDLLNPKNMKHDLYASFLFQICFPSRIKMEIDAEYTPIKKKRIAIVSCKSHKQDYTCSADEMYSPSTMYKLQKEFCLKGYDDYYIISSKYGIVHHTQIIKPYDITLAMNTHSKNYQDIEIQSWGEDMLKLIDEQLTWMKKKGWEIDYHTSKVYYSLLPKETKAKINYIKQPPGVGAARPRYEQAIKMLDEKTLEECLKFISSKNQNKPKEQDIWYFHKEYPPFFGTSAKIATQYKELNLDGADMWKVSMGRVKHAKGWVKDKSLLSRLHKNDKGQWRLKK